MAEILESDDFYQFFGTTLRGYLGHLTPFNFWMNGNFGWPWVGSIRFCGQIQNPRSDPLQYHSKSPYYWQMTLINPLSYVWNWVRLELTIQTMYHTWL